MGKSDKINIKERVDDTTIDLSLSDISEIPVSGIANFKRATILDLSSNKITTLGKNFCTLTHLTKLDLSKNQLKFLPEDISKLTNIRHLDLYNNQLEHLPLAFGKLKNLRYLDLKGNPLTPALAKIVGPCLTLKDCQSAARNTVKFFAQMQQTIDEDRERARTEELERLEAEKEAERSEAVKEKPRGTTKKERKNDAKPKVESSASSEVDNGSGMEQESREPFTPTPAWKVILITFSFTSVIALGILITVARSPHIWEALIVKLPESYQAGALKYCKDLRKDIFNLFK